MCYAVPRSVSDDDGPIGLIDVRSPGIDPFNANARTMILQLPDITTVETEETESSWPPTIVRLALRPPTTAELTAVPR